MLTCKPAKKLYQLWNGKCRRGKLPILDTNSAGECCSANRRLCGNRQEACIWVFGVSCTADKRFLKQRPRCLSRVVRLLMSLSWPWTRRAIFRVWTQNGPALQNYMLYYIKLYYTIFIKLFYIIFYSLLLYCIVLSYMVLYYTTFL